MDNAPPAYQRVVIIGTGLLGASVALGLRQAGFAGERVGVGRSAATLDQARATGGFTALTTDLAEALGPGALVVIAVPLGVFEGVFARLAAHGDASLTITDVGSTKAQVVSAAQRILPWPGRFVGAHPMAGSEQKGPGAARGDLFRDRPCILTPGPGADPDAVAGVEALWRVLGMRLLRMDPAEHDRQTATVSHLPHLLSVALVNLATKRGGLGVASTGFRDTTRLASSNPPMRADIICANAEALGEAIKACRAELAELAERIAAGDAGALTAALEQTKAARDRWLAGWERPDPEA